jgi:hypothetical protein
MRNGSLSPGDYPGDVVHITCERCSRAGRYGCDRLIERYGADNALPDLSARINGMRIPSSRPPGNRPFFSRTIP